MVSQQAPEAGRGEQEEIILGDAGVEKKAATSKKDVRKKKKKTKKADENVLSSINKAIGRVATEQGNKIVGCAHGWAKKVEMNPGPFILAAGGFLFLLSIGMLVLFGFLQPKCFSDIMPCAIEEVGKCLCAQRANDGTCWQRMKPAMKCYKTTQFVTSGVCKGVYLTGFCAVDQKEADAATAQITAAFTSLHPSLTGTCNVSFSQEGLRCSLPKVRQDSRPFDHVDCCRAPIQTCVSDLDCCNCGLEAPACTSKIRCLVTSEKKNETAKTLQAIETSTMCEGEEDACLTFSYDGCRGLKEECKGLKHVMRAIHVVLDAGSIICMTENYPNMLYSKHQSKTVGYTYGEVDLTKSQADCKKSPTDCRSICAAEQKPQYRGCPCTEKEGGVGCSRKMCVKSSDFFENGGVEHILRGMGAARVRLCFTDNCNQ